MATFSGIIIDGPFTYVSEDPVERQPVIYESTFLPTQQVFYLAGSYENGTFSNLPDLFVARNHSGIFCGAYAEIFYNRILVDPLTVDFGNIVSDTSFSILLFNGFFTDTPLTLIRESNLDGVEITGPTVPTTLSPLQSLSFVVTATPSTGPPTIDGFYSFVFGNGIPEPVVQVVGTRVLPLPHLFQAGLTETLSWQTNIMTADNGYEQRTQLRSVPRHDYDFSIAIENVVTAQLDSILYGWRGNFFGLPISSECREITVATTPSSPNITVNTEFGDFSEGGLAMLYSSSTVFELVSIEALSTNLIVASTNITRVFPVGTLIMPVKTARLLSSPRRSTNGRNQRLASKFQIMDEDILPSAASPIQYKGLDVYLDEPLLLNGFITDTYDSRVDAVDFSVGSLDVFTPWIKPKVARSFGLQFNSLEEVWNHRLWLYRRAGKLRPFWMPTFEADFTLVSTGLLDIQLEVLDEGQFALTTERDDLAILLTDGSWLLREILSITRTGQNLLITLDAVVDVTSDTIVMLSFLGRKRLTSDRLNLAWNGNNRSSAAISVTEINN